MSRELEKMRSASAAKMQVARNTLSCENRNFDNHSDQIEKEYTRVSEISAQAPSIIENLDRQFKEKTKLSDGDIVFLMLCTALQCARQYILTNEKFRITAHQGDLLMQETVGQIVPRTWKEVLTQGVPYDAIATGDHISDTGLSGITHRYRTLGHDPILGWIFGTANIMTNSLTKTDFTTYQVSHQKIIRHYPRGTLGMLNRTATYAQNDPTLLGASVARQAIHFGSDYFTEQGLPIPLISTCSDPLVKNMILNGHIDLWSTTRGGILAVLINQLIAAIHRLFYREEQDGSETLYEIRTRKILSYSNAISAGSNIVITAFTGNLNLLDAGGILVALHRFISDHNFIQSIKRDFLKNEIYNMIVGSPYDFMEG